ncbi:tubby-like F-box protein 3-like isoform X1 [Hibiscus syriacus]|uniref:Beta-amylase n=1 Tax=Hibiscus syriacus TaxID=106335 RepID=A0A6A2WKH1_HIBSY|nr:tubby-like F-box protein 3-like isoform X1 [Hibiscus syriacus]
MEVSLMSSSQAKICKTELGCKDLRLRKTGIRFSAKAVDSEPILETKSSTSSKSLDRLRLFVGLPLDTVSDGSTINHARAIAAGLKALKLLGVEGVELPVWWGVVENEEMGKYHWSGYLAVAEMVQKAGLKLHVSLCFHSSDEPKIPLPKWVMKIGESQSSIFFTDRSGHHYRKCLSLAVDDLPVLDGKTPIQVYQDLCESFKSAFSPFIGSTITGISMGLGPDGELRYPSHHKPKCAKNGTISGVGEFQCYDTNMLKLLKQHAEANGNPLWGLGGPHDALVMISHRTGITSSTITVGLGKVLMATSSFLGIQASSCRDVCKEFVQTHLAGMDLSDKNQPHDSLSSPESLLAQIQATCNKHEVEVAGQNLASGSPGGLEQIKKNMLGDNPIDLFTYQRMGAHFFSPEHFPSFTEFIRSLNQPEMHPDDMPSEEVEATESVQTSSDPNIHLQTA